MLSGPSKAVIAVSTVFPGLAFFAVALRVYARRLKSQVFAADDYLIILALIVSLASCVPYIIGATIGGIGMHIGDLSQAEFIRFGKVLFGLQFTYIAAVALVKISILLFYRRIFCTPAFRRRVNIVLVTVCLWFVAIFFATLFQVKPVSVNWTAGKADYMINEYAMYTASAVIEMLLDIVTLVLPWPVIWTLQIDTKRKWNLSGIFLLGGFVCVASIVRLYYLVSYLNPTTIQTIDFTYETANIIIWSAIEPCAGVICACLPTLGPIFATRSAESLVGSLRKARLFRSLRGSETSLADKEKPSSSRSSVSRPFFFNFTNSSGKVTTDVRRGSRVGADLEKQRVPAGAIVVDESVLSVDEERGVGR